MSLTKLAADLNVISNLVIPLLTEDVETIQKLSDEPNDVDGLTAAELKAKFDKAGIIIKEYLNEVLIPQLSDTVAEANVRAAAEQERVENENLRIANEDARKGTEDFRVLSELTRSVAEDGRVSAEEQRVLEETGRVTAEQDRVSGEAAREKAETARSVWEDYDGDRTYEPGNKVAYQGNSYLNKKVCRGVEPTDTECWLMIARRGSQGDQGAPGKIADVYETLSQLRASLPEGDEQMYQVAEEGLCYIWSERSGAWVSCGRFQGPAAEPEEVPVILQAQAWQGENAPWQLTVEVPGLLKNSLGDIGLAENATTEERAAARAALISVTAQEAGSVTLIADGKKPEVDIPALVQFYTNTGSGSGGYIIGGGLKLDKATNTLSVDTVEAVEKDNTKPVTSAAVFVEIGNIEALLAAL